MSFLAGCAPGTLPCEKPEWKEICASDGSPPVTPMGGSPGGTGGMSGAGGMMGTGGGGGPMDKGAKQIMNCSKWPTVKSMDAFFLNRCGGMENGCHAQPFFGTEFKTENVWMRVLAANSNSCGGLKMASGTKWEEGSIWSKTLDPPTCQGGATPGKDIKPRMPSKLPADMMDKPLTDEEKTCLENFLKALVD